jgi:hypothetical protein
MKRCLCCNLEDFDFFDSEIRRTRVNDLPVQSNFVGVSEAKRSVIAAACFAVIGNTNIRTIPTKAWTQLASPGCCADSSA